jgi:hypothetical protein
MMEALSLSQVNPGDRKHKRKKAFVTSIGNASGVGMGLVCGNASDLWIFFLLISLPYEIIIFSRLRNE